MSIRSDFRLRKAFFWAFLVLGVAFVSLGVGRPVSAQSGVQPELTPAAVVNDDFDDALIITTVPYSNTQDILTATTALDDPSFPCYSGQRYNTVWYRYTPSASESFILSREGSQYSTVLGVWTGERGSLTNEACSTTSSISVTLSAGITYHIEIARSSDYIIPEPTTMVVVFSAYPADTPPAEFGKIGPADGAVYQSTRPTLSWAASTYAVSYATCIDTSDNGLCDSSWVTASGKSVELTGLSQGTTYSWQVRAMSVGGEVDADGGTWWSFTTAAATDLNPWTGVVSGSTRPVSFDVLTDGTQWLNYSVTVSFTGCSGTPETAKVSVGGPGPITSRTFSYRNPSGSLRFSGAFGSPTTASGSYTLSSYAVCDWIEIPGYCCWVAASTSGTWTATGPALPGYEVYLPLVLHD